MTPEEIINECISRCEAQTRILRTETDGYENAGVESCVQELYQYREELRQKAIRDAAGDASK